MPGRRQISCGRWKCLRFLFLCLHLHTAPAVSNLCQPAQIVCRWSHGNKSYAWWGWQCFILPSFSLLVESFSQSTLVYISNPEGRVVSESYHVTFTTNTRVNGMVRPAVLGQKFHVAVFKNYKYLLRSRKLNI